MPHRAANPVIAQLQERIAHLESGAARARQVLPFGISEIDRRLPGGGRVRAGMPARGCGRRQWHCRWRCGGTVCGRNCGADAGKGALDRHAHRSHHGVCNWPRKGRTRSASASGAGAASSRRGISGILANGCPKNRPLWRQLYRGPLVLVWNYIAWRVCHYRCCKGGGVDFVSLCPIRHVCRSVADVRTPPVEHG